MPWQRKNLVLTTGLPGNSYHLPIFLSVCLVGEGGFYVLEVISWLVKCITGINLSVPGLSFHFFFKWISLVAGKFEMDPNGLSLKYSFFSLSRAGFHLSGS